MSGEHLKMSKKGNKRLRRLLFSYYMYARNKLIIIQLEIYKMQQTSGMKSMVASFACANKF